MSNDSVDVELLLDTLRRVEGDRIAAAYQQVQQNERVAEQLKAQAALLTQIRVLVTELADKGEVPDRYATERMEMLHNLSRFNDALEKMDNEQGEKKTFDDRGVR
jgi:hypothetical protein